MRTATALPSSSRSRRPPRRCSRWRWNCSRTTLPIAWPTPSGTAGTPVPPRSPRLRRLSLVCSAREGSSAPSWAAEVLGGIAAAGWLVGIGRGLRETFFMFWETLWPLVLGFGLSGAVQAFVSRDALQRKLGTNRPAAVARASGYGMVSSSCSYAASAMAKSPFVKGADFVPATVFMFASTNLVIELGIVLIVLMGWQFAASEFAGGVIMIVLLAGLGGLWLRGRVVAQARERLSYHSTDLVGGPHPPA